MKKKNLIKSNKIVLLFFLISLIINIVNINLNVNNFNKTFYYSDDDSYHGIIRTPPEIYIWKKAYEFKNNFSFNNLQNSEFRYPFLPSKILAFSGKIFNIKFFNKNDYDTNNLIFFFYFQTLLYLLSVIYLHKKLEKINLNNNVKNITTGFLFFEPTINQFHSTIFGETIFFALIIILLGFLISLPKKNTGYFILGALVSILYLQRNVAFLIFLIPVVIIFFKFKLYSFKKIIYLLSVYVFLLVSLGSINYQRSHIFYFFPTQTLDSLYVYFIPKLEVKISNKASQEISEELNQKVNKFILDRKLDLSQEQDRITKYQFQKKYAYDVIFSNKIKTLEIALISSIHSMLLNPTETIFTRIEGRNYYKSDLHQKTIKYRIVYSLFMYFFILLGFINCLINKRLSMLIFSLVGLYFLILSGWIGYTRYYVATYLTLSIYFGFGLNLIFEYLKKINAQKYNEN